MSKYNAVKRANDSGGDIRNYVVGMGKKFPTPTMATASSPSGLSAYTSCSSNSAATVNVGPACRNEFPGCQVTLSNAGVNSALQKYMAFGGKVDQAGTVQLGHLFDQPETQRVNSIFRTTGVNEPEWVSPNQKLAGKANPKFNIPPVVPAPMLDTDYWRTNNLVIRSGINDTNPFDERASGYAPRDGPIGQGATCAGCPHEIVAASCYQLPNTKLCPSDSKTIIHPEKGFEYDPPRVQPSPRPSDVDPDMEDPGTTPVIEEFNPLPATAIQIGNWSGGTVAAGNDPANGAVLASTNTTGFGSGATFRITRVANNIPSVTLVNAGVNYKRGDVLTLPNVGGGGQYTVLWLVGSRPESIGSSSARDIRPPDSGIQFQDEAGYKDASLIGQNKARVLPCESCDQLVDDHCVLINNGYHQDNLKVGLPTNFPASECGLHPSTAEFNTDVFTSTVAPKIYQNSQIIEPINAMMGISFTQQIPPTTLSEQDGELLFEQHDPNLYQPEAKKLPDQSPNASNVTDPRFTGYGASNRSYLEPMTGQTRFYYKDVDCIRMPNYVSRSKIDVNEWADKYGPVPDRFENGNPETHNIHALANNAFLDATIEQRTSLMQSLMRKRNAELYQTRLMPLSNNRGM